MSEPSPLFLPEHMLRQQSEPPPPYMRREPERLIFPHCPPKLQQRMVEYGIELPDFAPVFDRVFVYPLERTGQPETTAGGIVLPETTRHRLGAQRGVLVGAGPKAIEQLYSHGVSLGDIVISARLSPWERSYASSAGNIHRVLVLRAEDLVGSEDLKVAYDRGELRLEMDETGHVQLADRERIDPEETKETR